MRWIRAGLKAIGLTLVGCIVLALLLYLVIGIVNWNDRKPSQLAEQLQQQYQARPPVADAENGYVYVMGFTAGPEQDPVRAGIERVAWAREVVEITARTIGIDKVPLPEDPIAAPANAAPRDPLVEHFRGACQPGGQGCAEAFTNGTEIYDRWIATESQLLPRYSQLLARQAWLETAPIDLSTPLPGYARVMDGQRLALLEARRLAMQRDYEGAQRLLESDLRFWRVVFESADTLIVKMIATVALVRHFELGNLILRDLDSQAAALVMPADWRMPITESERSMRRCMRGEWLFFASMAKSLDPFFSPELAMERKSHAGRVTVAILGRPLYQSQDLINRYADYYTRVGELLDAPFEDYEEARSTASELSARIQKSGWPPRSLYNILGSWVASQGMSDYANYGARAADVEGVRRAAIAAVTLRAAKVDKADVAEALRASELRNPYDGRPFEWSATDSAIRFRGLAEGERGLHLLYY
ncbi:MAG TPA: hypothetical protein VJS12_16330 [Steroidobacteraceae bacterium]|nr:hypothetical protein [Steroidobacteraceae bacterium]